MNISVVIFHKCLMAPPSTNQRLSSANPYVSGVTFFGENVCEKDYCLHPAAERSDHSHHGDGVEFVLNILNFTFFSACAHELNLRLLFNCFYKTVGGISRVVL